MRMQLVFLFCCVVIAALFFDHKLLNLDHQAGSSRPAVGSAKSEVLPDTQAFASVAPDASKAQKDQEGQSRASIRLTAENQAELQRCGVAAGRDLATLDDVIQGLSQGAGKAEKRALIWRNVHFQSPDGEERRLRIWRDFSVGVRGRLKAQLYTLDEEGLPVPLDPQDDELSNPTIKGTEKYLEGAKIHETQEKVSLTFGEPKHLSLSFETRDGFVRSFEAKDDSMALQCFTAPQAEGADCKCLGQAH